MNTKELLAELEETIRDEKPLVFERLQFGLSEDRINKLLKRKKVEGHLDVLSDIYSWKNGTRIDTELSLSDSGFIFNEIYQFLDLETALDHFKSFEELIDVRKEFEAAANRLFPILWDGVTSYFAVDLTSEGSWPVYFIELEESEPIVTAYDSLELFLKDVIKSHSKKEEIEFLSS